MHTNIHLGRTMRRQLSRVDRGGRWKSSSVAPDSQARTLTHPYIHTYTCAINHVPHPSLQRPGPTTPASFAAGGPASRICTGWPTRSPRSTAGLHTHTDRRTETAGYQTRKQDCHARTFHSEVRQPQHGRVVPPNAAPVADAARPQAGDGDGGGHGRTGIPATVPVLEDGDGSANHA